MLKSHVLLPLLALAAALPAAESGRPRLREFGLTVGVLDPGTRNAITDVEGVLVGHVTLIEGSSVRTGVTAVLPHGGNLYQEKVPAGIAVANGYGKLTGFTQVEELGTLETPVILTNTLSVPVAAEAVIEYTLTTPGNERVLSVNPVVGETNDGWLNDIRGRHVTRAHVLEAIRTARGGPVVEGAVGAGTGTTCFDYKGGIGTSSRRLPAEKGGYTVGVLVQTNFGGDLRIPGLSLPEKPGAGSGERPQDGSCLMVVATNAPLDGRSLKRLAARALLGIARTGGFNAHGSGDYAVAFSTAPEARTPHRAPSAATAPALLRPERLTPLFQAAAEAAEEAILNSLFKAESMEGRDGRKAEALPLDRLKSLLPRSPCP